jgi:hypothetical protein
MLFIQDLVLGKALIVRKVASEDNIADIMTKAVDGETLKRLSESIGMRTGPSIETQVAAMGTRRERAASGKKLVVTLAMAAIASAGAEQDKCLTVWKPAQETGVPWAMMLLIFVVTYEVLRWCGKWVYEKVRSGMRADAAASISVPLLSSVVEPPEDEKDDYTICRELVEWWENNRDEVRPRPAASSSSQAQWTEVHSTATPQEAGAEINCDYDEVMVTKYGKKFHVHKCHGMSVVDPTAITRNTQCSQCMPDRWQTEIYVSTDGTYHRAECEFGRSYGNEPRRMELCKHCQASGRA